MSYDNSDQKMEERNGSSSEKDPQQNLQVANSLFQTALEKNNTSAMKDLLKKFPALFGKQENLIKVCKKRCSSDFSLFEKFDFFCLFIENAECRAAFNVTSIETLNLLPWDALFRDWRTILSPYHTPNNTTNIQKTHEKIKQLEEILKTVFEQKVPTDMFLYKLRSRTTPANMFELKLLTNCCTQSEFENELKEFDGNTQKQPQNVQSEKIRRALQWACFPLVDRINVESMITALDRQKWDPQEMRELLNFKRIEEGFPPSQIPALTEDHLHKAKLLLKKIEELHYPVDQLDVLFMGCIPVAMHPDVELLLLQLKARQLCEKRSRGANLFLEAVRIGLILGTNLAWILPILFINHPVGNMVGYALGSCYALLCFWYVGFRFLFCVNPLLTVDITSLPQPNPSASSDNNPLLNPNTIHPPQAPNLNTSEQIQGKHPQAGPPATYLEQSGEGPSQKPPTSTSGSGGGGVMG